MEQEHCGAICFSVSMELLVIVRWHGRFAVLASEKWRGSASFYFLTCGAPQVTKIKSVVLIWQLGHIGKGADVFPEPP